MAYQGWRVKMNDVIFPNYYMEKGSYSCVAAKRIIDSWLDADGIEHQEVSAKKKAQIRFRIKQHDSREHAAICNLLVEEEKILVTYFSDKENDYVTGIFRVEDIEFSHLNTVGNNIYYDSADVVLVEY